MYLKQKLQRLNNFIISNGWLAISIVIMFFYFAWFVVFVATETTIIMFREINEDLIYQTEILIHSDETEKSKYLQEQFMEFLEQQ